MPLLRRFVEVLVLGSRVERCVITYELDIAWAEVHVQRVSVFVRDLIDQIEKLGLLFGVLGHLVVALGRFEEGPHITDGQHTVVEMSERCGEERLLARSLLVAPVVVPLVEPQMGQVRSSFHDFVEGTGRRCDRTQSPTLGWFQTQETNNVGTVGVIGQTQSSLIAAHPVVGLEVETLVHHMTKQMTPGIL